VVEVFEEVIRELKDIVNRQRQAAQTGAKSAPAHPMSLAGTPVHSLAKDRLERLAPAQEPLLRLTAQMPQFVSSTMYVGFSMRKGNGGARLDMRLPPYGELASKDRNSTS
jgi:hypothetical protein